MQTKPASFMKRIYAYIIDQLLLSFAIGYPLSLAMGDLFDSAILAGAVTILFSIAYWALMDYWFGQSLGKQAVKIRTSGAAKIKISFWQAALRSLAKPFLVALLLDCIPLIFGRDFRFSDRLAGTRVIEWDGSR